MVLPGVKGLIGASKLKIIRVCREMRPILKPNVYDRSGVACVQTLDKKLSGGDSRIPSVAKSVRMDRALPNPFPIIAKRSITAS